MMKFEIYDHRGKLVISQAVVMKVLGIKDLNIKMERFSWIFDIRHNNYGIISVKQAIPRGEGRIEGHRFVTENHKKNKKWGIRIDCDTYCCLALDKDWKNVEAVYIIPNNGWVKDLETITIYRHTYSSKYYEFRVDEKPYNNALHSLMKYIGNITMIDVYDVKEWLKKD